jgi:hypothetical protein
METLFSGPVRHRAWTQKKVYPPDGMPPLPEHVLARAQRVEDVRKGDDKYESEHIA